MFICFNDERGIIIDQGNPKELIKNMVENMEEVFKINKRKNMDLNKMYGLSEHFYLIKSSFQEF